MTCRTNSFLLQTSVVCLTFLAAVLIAAAHDINAQTRSGADVFQKAAFKPATICAVPAEGAVTALVKNGVELSVIEDWDCDGIPDAYDNCVAMPNTPQGDSDKNGVGDVCEAAATVKSVSKAANVEKKRSAKISRRDVKDVRKKKTTKT